MIAAVFPGQGSQKPGMGSALYAANAAFRATFDRIAAADGRDLRGLVFEGDEATLRDTRVAQSALYACGVAAYRAWGGAADAFAGHSIGEYAALAAAGVVSEEDGARLVRERGERMATAPAGAMAAVLGMERDALSAILNETEGTVVVANDNSPGQLVISGDAAAVAAAGERLKAAGAKRVLPLNVSGAFHSPLMIEAAEGFRAAVARATFNPGGAVVSNVTADVVAAPATWPDLLVRQLASPVRWTESVQRLAELGATEFIEFGAGEVLGGLIRRIVPEAATRRVAEPSDL